MIRSGEGLLNEESRAEMSGEVVGNLNVIC